MRTQHNRFDLWALIIGGIFIVPFIYQPLTIDPVLPIRYLFWCILTFSLILIVIFRSVRRTNSYDFKIASRWIFFFAGCFSVSAILSFSRAINLPEALFDLQKHILFFIFFYAASMIIGLKEADIYVITKSVIVSGIVLALIGIGRFFPAYFFSVCGESGFQVVMANKNLYSSALFLITPFALFGAFRLSGFWRILSSLSVLLVHFAMFLTKTRSVWLAVFLSASVLFLTVLYFNKHHKKQISKVPSGTLMLLMVILLATVSLFICLNQTNTSSIVSTKSLKIRFALWDVTMKMIWDKPFLGCGPGQWKIVSPPYGKTLIENNETIQNTVISYQRPHNDYLWILSEYGFLGFIFYTLFWGFVGFYLFKIFTSDTTDKTKIFCLCMLYGMTGYLVISFFSFPKERIFHNVLLALILASVVSAYHRACPHPVKQRKLPIKWVWVHGVLLLILVFFILTGYMRMNSEMHAKKAVSALKSKKWDQAVKESDLTCLWFYNMDIVSNPIPWYRGVANFSSGRINDAVIDFERACSIHPWHASSHYNLGACYARMGMRKRAEKSFENAVFISPRFKDAYLNLKGKWQ